MTKTTVVVLAVVNAALLAFILIYERGTLATSDTAGRSNLVLRTFVRDRVDRVELVRGDDPAIVFVREREDDDDDDVFSLGRWVIAGPVETSADDDAVDGLLSALEWLGQHRTLEGITSDDRERFGLAEPRFVVRYTVLAQVYELRVGGEAPTGEGIYVGVEGDGTAYVVGEDFIESIDHDLAHFRNKELFEGFYPVGTERVQVDSIVFEREDGVWRLRAPGTGWANQGLIDRLLRVTRELRAVRFVAEDAENLSEYGLDAPWHELTVTRGEDVEAHRTAHLRVGDPCGEHDGERYAIDGDEGPVVCVEVSDLEALEVDRTRLREPRLIAVRDIDVRSIVLRAGGERIELSREEDNWKIFTGPGGDRGEPVLADDAAVAAWLTELRDTRADVYEELDESAHGLGSPSVRLTIRLSGEDDAPLELRFGDVDDDGVWVVRGTEDAMVRFPAALAETLRVDALRFRARTVFEAEASDASRIDVTRGGIEERAVRGQGGTWNVEVPIEAEADRIVVREIARQLGALRAERFVAESATDEHGLSSPRVVVSTTFTPEEGEERSVTLLIGAETPDGSYAQLEGGAAVFLLAEDRVEPLLRSLVSLDLLTVDTEGLESIRFERGEELVVLRREGTEWRTEEGGTPDRTRLRAMLDRLGTLRALGVDSYADSIGPVDLRLVATRRPTVEGERTITIEIGPVQGDGDAAIVLLRRDGLGVVYTLRAQLARSLTAFAP